MTPSLLSFYFGAVNENERLQIERNLLSDPEILLEFLELKRELEAAQKIPEVPSSQLWARLQLRLPKGSRARWTLAASLIFAVAASIVLILNLRTQPDLQPDSVPHGVLFDGGHEQMGLSNVL